jgi:hypothetical protein
VPRVFCSSVESRARDCMDDATSTVQMCSVLSQLIREELSFAAHTLDVYTHNKWGSSVAIIQQVISF